MGRVFRRATLGVLGFALSWGLVISGQPALAATAQPAVDTGVLIRPATAAGKVTKITRVKVRPAGFGKLKVSWKRSAKAAKIWVVASTYSDGLYSNLTPSSKRWKSRTLRGTANSVVLTVPARFRNIVGGNAGNAVYVKVFAKGGGKTTRSSSAKCNWTGGPVPVGTYAQRVRFATYNIQGVQASAKIAGRSWAVRRTAVRNAIVRSKADVVAVQEANLTNWNGRRQVDDLAALIAPYGYKLAYSAGSIGGTAGTGATKESHLFYKTSRIDVLGGGVQSSKAVSYGLSSDRQFAWAYMRSRATGKTFYAASIHPKVGSTSAAAADRLRMVSGIETWMRKKANGRPVVLAGDFNSDIRRWPNGPEALLVGRGWVNAASAPVRVNYKYASVNHKGNGYPAKPVISSVGQVGTRIDNIFMYRTGGAWSYENQIVLGSGGRFNEAYRGSDHNLQVSTISIR